MPRRSGGGATVEGLPRELERSDGLLGCGGRPRAGCGVLVRFLHTAIRIFEPAVVFASVLLAYEIQVYGDDAPAELSQHPGQVIDERRLSHASLVVEEGDRRHGRLRTVTRTNAS